MNRIARRLTLLCVLGAMPWQVSAGSFSVNPVRLELAPSQNATSVTVSNFGSNPLLLQVRVYRWAHVQNEDVLTEVKASEAPTITPPLFRLAAANGSQVIRIGFSKPYAPPAEERQWRVILEEVQKPNNPLAADGEASAESPNVPVAVALRLRVSLPLLQRPAKIHQEVQWMLVPSFADRQTLTAINLGSITERLDEVRLGPTDHESFHLHGPLYLFPGERRSFEVHSDVALATGKSQLSLQGTPRPLTRELVLRAQ